MIANGSSVDYWKLLMILAIQYQLLKNWLLVKKKSIQSDSYIRKANNAADFVFFIYLDLTCFLLIWFYFGLERVAHLVCIKFAFSISQQLYEQSREI